MLESLWKTLVGVVTGAVDLVRTIPDLPWLLPELAGSYMAAVVWSSLALAVVLFVGMRQQLKRAERSAQIAGDDLLEPTGTEDGESLEVLDLRSGSLPRKDRRSFRQGWREIRRSLGLSSPYEVPRYLFFGQTDAGKTTALENTDLEKPLGSPPDGAVGVQWWYYDRALALDVKGAYVLEATDDTADRPAHRGLLRLLRRSRPRRPLDGVVFTLPSTELSCFDPSDSAAADNLTRRAEVLRRELVQMQQNLCVRLPIFVLITQADRLEGYGVYSDTLPP
ncbi:MAG: hypothetical protein MI919_10850, partial [Holophagales bacterium]|nr:hypothetical protein [Holophagales bacterium]